MISPGERSEDKVTGESAGTYDGANGAHRHSDFTTSAGLRQIVLNE
jgi:hypothetical protein